MTRRSRPQIFAEILEAIISEMRTQENPLITRIQSRVYVPFNRLKVYLEVMRDKGLIEEASLKATEEGLRYLEQYKSVRSFLERFGLE